MQSLFRRLWAIFRRRQWEAELEEELAFHREMKERELAASGDTTSHVQQEARRALGNITLMREEARYAVLPVWADGIRRDIAYAVRSLANHSGFVVLVVPMLTIGLGVNVSFMTVFNALALRPWPVAEPDRVVTLDQASAEPQETVYRGFPLAARAYLESHSKTLAHVIAARRSYDPLDGDLAGSPAPLHYVSGNFFDALGVRLARGRGFLPQEDRSGAPVPVAVLSYRIWQSRYSADPDVIGRQIRIGEIPVTVVGVVAEEFQGLDPGTAAIYAPMALLSLVRQHDPWIRSFLADATSCCAVLYARLAPGVSREEAGAELDLLVPAFREEHKLTPIPDAKKPARVLGLRLLDHPDMRKGAAPFFTLMFFGMTMATLLVCVTAGNLLVARATAREQEIATRLALGASRGRVIRQLLTESAVLALLGGAGALVLAAWLPNRVLPLLTDGEAESLYLPLDSFVAVYTLGLSLIACLIFGLTPALHGTNTSLYIAAKRGVGSGVLRLRLRNSILALQIALSVILLAGASLTLRGVAEASRRDIGFRVDDVSSVSILLPASSRSPAERLRLGARIESLLAELPESAAWARTSQVPLSSSAAFASLQLPGASATEKLQAAVLAVSDRYFDLLQIPLIAGRGLSAEDSRRDVVVVNQAMAHKFWPEGHAVGRTFLTGKREREVVGIVADAELMSLGARHPMFFEPAGQEWVSSFLVQSLDEPFLAHLRRLALALDPGAQLRVRTLRENLNREIAPLRAGAKVAGALGVFALILSAVGIAGVVGYVVERRTREIGVRVALGARVGHIVRLVAWSGGKAAIIGGAVGLFGAVAGSRLLEGRLFGLSSLDLPSYLLALGSLAIVCVCAGFVPLRNAVRIDPGRALRQD